MRKKISLKYYRNPESTEIVEIDYNELNQDYYTNKGKRRWLLGSAEDRIEAYLLRKNWTKINVAQFNKLLDKYKSESDEKIKF
jgi:hypothetical protein